MKTVDRATKDGMRIVSRPQGLKYYRLNKITCKPKCRDGYHLEYTKADCAHIGQHGTATRIAPYWVKDALGDGEL